MAGAESVWPLPELPAATTVPISSLVSSTTPRSGGEDRSHIQTLAEVDTGLPPILVHQGTGRVIDGMHRLRAALLRGEDMIEARFIDVGEEEAFVIAVSANVSHGLPLSLADRKAAAERIVAAHPEWSDRTIAATVGLSPKTVGAVRRRSGADLPHLNDQRIGRDGRVYPINGADGQRRIRRAMAAHPEASVRQIAAIAGVSVGTAHKVRERLRQPAPRSSGGEIAGRRSPEASPRGDRVAAHDRRDIGQRLKRDPALRHSESGRSLIRWVNASSAASEESGKFIDEVPARWLTTVTALARSYAREWQRLAGKLDEQRRRDTG